MRINLEEAACVVLAVFMLIGSVTAQIVVAPAMIEHWEMPEFLAVTLNAVIVSAIGFYGVIKLPGSWYFKIIYDSVEDEESDDNLEASFEGC